MTGKEDNQRPIPTPKTEPDALPIDPRPILRSPRSGAAAPISEIDEIQSAGGALGRPSSQADHGQDILGLYNARRFRSQCDHCIGLIRGLKYCVQYPGGLS